MLESPAECGGDFATMAKHTLIYATDSVLVFTSEVPAKELCHV